MKNKFKKYLSILMIIGLIYLQVVPIRIYAEDPISAPAVTEQTTTPSPTPASETTITASPTPSPTPDSTQIIIPEQTGPLSDAERAAREAAAKAAWEQQFFTAHPELDKTNNQTGTTALQTGTATNSVTSLSSGNLNGSASSPQGASFTTPQSSLSGPAVTTSGNGAVSDNNSQLTSGTTIDTDQTNSAQVGNNINQSSVTGMSSTSFNVGDSTLTTGDANVSGTAITGLNTNLSNVTISEFNVVDNQKGDIILSPEAFAANCISGCSASNIFDTNTAQTNSAGVGNNLTLAANSGNNTGSFNTGGNTTINTGDANVAANSLTFVNNNIAGGVTFGVVNIYGNLEGDIILPEFTSGPSVGAVTTADTTNNTSTFQNNDANIANNLTLNGQTGNNSTNDNTSGNTTTNTGSSTVDTNVLNIANNNITGGTWWLVLVNEAGNWVGKLLGGPDGAKMAGSPGTEFRTDANGQITATNGAGSNNTTNVSNTTNTNTTQQNNATVENNLNLSANTGGNRTDFNTGGHNIINTGDSNIIANLVNFVDNNIVGNGRLMVTFVNVFGSWKGDFVTPGQHPSAPQGRFASSGQEQSAGLASNAAKAWQATTGSLTGNVSPTPVGSDQTVGTDRVVSDIDGAVENIPQGVSNGQISVAGINSETSQTHMAKVMGNDKNVVTINLAWLVIIIPLLVLIFIGRKIIRSRF